MNRALVALTVAAVSVACAPPPAHEGEGEAGEGEGATESGEGEGEGEGVALPVSCSDPSAKHCSQSLTDGPVIDDAGLATFAGCNVFDTALDIEGPVTSLSALTDAICIPELTVNSASITSLAGLAHVIELGGITLTGDTELRDISALALASPTIHGFALDGSAVTSLHGLEGATDMSISIASSPISDLSPLAHVTHALQISLDHIPVATLDPLSSITSIDNQLNLTSLPQLTTLGGFAPAGMTALDVENTGLHALDLSPGVVQLPNGLRVANNPFLARLTAPGLTSAEVLQISEGTPGMTTLELPALTTVTFASNIDVAGLTALSLPALTTTTSLYVHGDDLVSISADALTSLFEIDSDVGFGLHIEKSPHFATISFASLASVAPNVQLNDLPALTSLAGFSALTDVEPSQPQLPPPPPPPGSPPIVFPPAGFFTVANTGIHDLTGLSALTHPISLSVSGDALESADGAHLADGTFLAIGGASLTSLSALSSTNLFGISIAGAPLLASLDGLQGSDGLSVNVQDCPSLTSLDGLDPTTMTALSIVNSGVATASLPHLTTVTSVQLFQDSALSSLSFPSLTTASTIGIQQSALTSLTGLGALTTVDILELDDNASLTSLAGLSSLQSVTNQLRIIAAPIASTSQSLTSLGVAPASIHILDIEEEAALTSLSSLSSTSIDIITLQDVPALASLDGLQGSAPSRFSITNVAAITTLDPVRLPATPAFVGVFNTGITTLGNAFAGVTTVTESLLIENNAALPQCQVDAVVAAMSPAPSAQTSGNSSACP